MATLMRRPFAVANALKTPLQQSCSRATFQRSFQTQASKPQTFRPATPLQAFASARQSVFKNAFQQGNKRGYQSAAPPNPLAQGNITQRLIYGGAIFGGTLLAINLIFNRETREDGGMPPFERSYLNDTFLHTGLGIGIIGIAARALHLNGWSYRLMSANPWLVLGIGLIGSIGTMMGCRATPPDNYMVKYGLWAGFNLTQAALLSPLMFFSPAILARAGLYTVGMMGSIAFVGATAKQEKYLYLGGPLLAGVAIVALSGLAPLVLPVTATRTLMFTENLWLYGGLAVFGGFTLYDIQKILHHARMSERGDFERPLGERKAELDAGLAEPPKWLGPSKEPTATHSNPQRGPLRQPRHGEYNRPSAPLIDQVTNSWRNEEKSSAYYISAAEDEGHELRFCDPEEEGSCPNTSIGLLQSRRFRRICALLVAMILVMWYGWRYTVPYLRQEWEYKQGFLSSQSDGTYGLARAGDFEGTAIKWIDPALVPGGEADPEGKRRLVFVGDIHGCKQELLELLKKVHFNTATDHLIPTGDVISKGPDNTGVLDELIRLKAESLRGNHEDRILEAAKTLLPADLDDESLSVTSKGSKKDRKLLKHLKRRHMQYLRDMPLMLRIPALPQATDSSWRKDNGRITEEIIVVHAGLVPHLPLKKQDPYFVMNMRSIDHITHVPSALHQTKKGKSRPWMQIWNWYNDRLARGRSTKGFHLYTKEEYEVEQAESRQSWIDRIWGVVTGSKKKVARPQVAVYGHDSKKGLQLHRWSKGLDSGCVKGGQLTALVLDAQGKTEVVQVECKDRI